MADKMLAAIAATDTSPLATDTFALDALERQDAFRELYDGRAGFDISRVELNGIMSAVYWCIREIADSYSEKI